MILFALGSCAIIALCYITHINILPVPVSLSRHVMATDNTAHPLLLDRNAIPLNSTYTTRWNQSDQTDLHKIPLIIQKIFVLSEDRHFYNHTGVDWIARIHALVQNIAAGRAIRGASTITEQVIRMIHPRKRTMWSRWIEGFEANKLEKVSSKPEILEFYLNQVPYASNRRGVVQASRFYFDRDLNTLNIKEVLALATLVRAPSAYDLYNHPGRIDDALARLVNRAISAKLITTSEWNEVKNIPFNLKNSKLHVDAAHFIKHVYGSFPLIDLCNKTHIKTTLDSVLQNRVQNILSTTLSNLARHRVINGAALVVAHKTGDILAWVISSRSLSGSYKQQKIHGDKRIYPKYEGMRSGTQQIDSIKAIRQPGSAMKPFLYALALEKGWSAATLIDDAPLKEPVGVGMHTYHNYSRVHYGAVTLRNALGNSLNIPAVKTIQFTGVDTYLNKLKELGITALKQHPDFYGDGLALGNGEISLYEMVQAYSVLANSGQFIELTPFYHVKSKNFASQDNFFADLLLSDHECLDPNYFSEKNSVSDVNPSRSVFSQEVASIIGNILSDPGARVLEFGGSDLLNFPVQTAVKTGTSSDYKDAWATGYNSHYTAGVWMGNLDGSSTVGLTGSRGPALVLRSIFAELSHIKGYGTRMDINQPLYMSPGLIQKEICTNHPGTSRCVTKTEWFVPDNVMEKSIQNLKIVTDTKVKDRNKSMSTDTEINKKNNTDKKHCKKENKSERKTKIYRLINPVDGLEVAMDPRIPDEYEYMEFKVEGVLPGEQVIWIVDKERVDPQDNTKLPIGQQDYRSSLSQNSASKNSNPRSTIQWKIKRGYHKVYTRLIDKKGNVIAKEDVSFLVK